MAPGKTTEMTYLHSTYGGRYAAHGPMPRLNALRRLVALHVVPPLVVLRESAKYAGRIFPETWNGFLFRRFWGEGISSSDACFVMDSYEDVRLRSGFRSAGTDTAGGRKIFTDSEIIHGTFAPQAAAMLTALFLRHAGKMLRIVTDTELGHKKDATLICYGTSDSNFKTFDIEASSGSDLCQFSFDGRGQRAFRLGGQLHGMECRDGEIYDKAILLRLTNGQESSNCHIVCAGLSEWGSLAAVHYLTKRWKELHKRFDGFGQRRDFCVLLEVPCGRFEDAREIVSVVCWEPRTPPHTAPGSNHA
jgi:hypothetical protein